MSVLVAGGAAGLYAVTVVGVYRWYVWRQRATGGFVALRRLDWDALISDLLPQGARVLDDVPPMLPSGELTPPSLRRQVPEGARARRALLLQAVSGTALLPDDVRLRDAGFTPAEGAWVATVSQVRAHPELALERLEANVPSSAPEVYLREYLRLTLRVNVLNRELAVFASKRRLSNALARFGDAPCLYFARALASAWTGLNRAAIDDLGRAVYFSRQAPFYVQAVLDSPYIAQARPALLHQCRHALDAQQKPGERAAT